MKKTDLNSFVGKRIKIVLKNDFFYVGNITNLTEDTMHFVDRYNRSIALNLSSIDRAEIVDKKRVFRGSVLDTIGMLVLFFTSIIALFLCHTIYQEFRVGYNASIGNMSNESVTVGEELMMEQTTSSFDILIASIPFVTIAAGVAAIVLAFLIPSHPIFLIFSLLALAISVTLGAVFSNVLWAFVNESMFADLLAANPLISQMIQNFPWIMAIIGGLIIIANYSRPGGSHLS